jgi:hypothetical protein
LGQPPARANSPPRALSIHAARRARGPPSATPFRFSRA